MTLQPAFALAWNPAVGIPILIVGLLLLAAIWLFGQPKKEQGKRRVQPEPSGERREPTFGDEPGLGEDSFSALDDDAHDPLLKTKPSPVASQGELDVGLREELERLGATLAGERAAAAPVKPTGQAASIIDALRAPASLFDADAEASAPITPAAPITAAPVSASVSTSFTAAPATAFVPPATVAAPIAPPRTNLGRRPAQVPVERIVTLFVVARENQPFNGAELVVAAEKAGLEYGDMGIYHRLLDGKRELGPIFSVANMLKPGNFDLSRIDTLLSPGLSFFMALPAPLPALDAWDAMLPTAQRLAELLDGQVLDEERNALGRQRIAHIRDELRGWDRDHEGSEIIFGR